MMGRKISIVLGVLWLVFFCTGLFSGPAALTWAEQWTALWSDQGVASTILWDLRLPRLCMASLSGGALAVAGLLMQTYFKNPLAGPSVLGVTSGSTLGVALVSLGGVAVGAGFGLAGTVFGALAGAWSVMVLLGAVIGWFRSRSALLIFGLMVGYLTGAVVTVLQAGAEAGALQAFVVWGMGSFAHADWTGVSILAVVLVATGVWSIRHRHDLDMWMLGALTARSMGVNERSLTWAILTITGALAALVTAWCGPVAFLGLATPHLVRILYRQHGAGKLLLPVLLMGSVLALIADWTVRFTAVTLNAVLSMVGAPVVLWLLLRRSESSAP